MDVTPLIARDRKVIQSYAGGAFRISRAPYHGAVVVLPGDVLPWPVSGDLDNLTDVDFDVPAAHVPDIDVVLFGVGSCARPLTPALKESLARRGIRADIMDTGAACRTYNVLLAEGRRVMALLLPVEKKS
jgi:uncharacterized protein